MKEISGQVTLHGSPLTLVGQEVVKGQKAPDFHLIDGDLKEMHLSDFEGKVVLLVCVPSLDTPVCDMESRRFESEALSLGNAVEILVVSMDLPFAQKRWCGASHATRIKTASDHREASLGLAYGVLIKELRLLARAIFVIDQDGIVRSIHRVNELSKEPDYEEVLSIVRGLLNRKA